MIQTSQTLNTKRGQRHKLVDIYILHLVQAHTCDGFKPVYLTLTSDKHTRESRQVILFTYYRCVFSSFPLSLVHL